MPTNLLAKIVELFVRLRPALGIPDLDSRRLEARRTIVLICLESSVVAEDAAESKHATAMAGEVWLLSIASHAGLAVEVWEWAFIERKTGGTKIS